jgi:hypothetical protein
MSFMTTIPRTVLARDLGTDHLGLTFQAHTYPAGFATTPPRPHPSIFTAETIYYLKSGAILLNDSDLERRIFLRPDTELTVWDVEVSSPVMVTDGIWRTEAELEALPLLAIIKDNDPGGKPHAYQKRRCVIGGTWLNRWFCTTDADWPESSERLLREGDTYSTLWLPTGTS